MEREGEKKKYDLVGLPKKDEKGGIGINPQEKETGGETFGGGGCTRNS